LPPNKPNRYEPQEKEPEKKAADPTVWRISLSLEHKGELLVSVPLSIVEAQRLNLGFLVQGRVNELAKKWLGPKARGGRKKAKVT
jgi:hypothetical protein